MTAIDTLASTGYSVIVEKGADRIHVFFEGAYEKGDGVLIGTYGRGETAEQAAADYIKQIAGKTLVFGYGESRKEIVVIANLGGRTNGKLAAQQNKVTNLDRFRTMTVDELAEWLNKHAICFHDVYCCDCFPGKNCKYGWLRWLNKEYKPEPQK